MLHGTRPVGVGIMHHGTPSRYGDAYLWPSYDFIGRFALVVIGVLGRSRTRASMQSMPSAQRTRRGLSATQSTPVENRGPPLVILVWSRGDTGGPAGPQVPSGWDTNELIASAIAPYTKPRTP